MVRFQAWGIVGISGEGEGDCGFEGIAEGDQGTE